MIGHTKAQQFRFYMRDNGVPAMQYKLLCTTQDWSPLEGLLVWRVNAEGKTMLPDGEPRPCKPIPMKNLEDILKGISGHTILGEFKDSGCWWIMLASLRELDTLLDTCPGGLGRPTPR